MSTTTRAALLHPLKHKITYFLREMTLFKVVVILLHFFLQSRSTFLEIHFFKPLILTTHLNLFKGYQEQYRLPPSKSSIPLTPPLSLRSPSLKQFTTTQLNDITGVSSVDELLSLADEPNVLDYLAQ